MTLANHPSKPFGFILFFAINFAIKVVHITDYPLAIDEPLSTYFPLFDLGPLLRYFTTTQTAPLYDILMHFWIKLAGVDSIFLLRLPSLIFNSATAGLLFLTGGRFFNREIGTGAAGLFVFSNIQVHFAQENRPYALFTLLSLLALYQFLGFVKSPKKSAAIKVLSLDFIQLVFVHAALVYTHYFGFFVLFVELFACLIFKEISSDKRKFWFRVCMGVGATFLPIAYFVARLFYGTAIIGRWWLKAPETPEQVWYVLRQYTNSDWGTMVSLTFICMGYIYAFMKRIRLLIHEKILLLFFPVAWLGMLVVSYVTPIFLDRYTLYITPAFYLLLVLSMQRLLFNNYFRYGVAVAVTILFGFYTIPYFDRKWPLPDLLRKVNEIKTPETAVFICPGWFNLNYIYYTNRDLYKKELLRNELALELSTNCHIYSVHEAEMIDEKVVSKADQIILVDFNSQLGSPQNGVLKRIRSLKANSFEHFNFEELNMYRLK